MSSDQSHDRQERPPSIDVSGELFNPRDEFTPEELIMLDRLAQQSESLRGRWHMAGLTTREVNGLLAVVYYAMRAGDMPPETQAQSPACQLLAQEADRGA